MSLTREQIEACLQQARRDDWHIEMDPGKIRVLCDMALRTERAEAERDGWKERAESSEHNFGVLHDELAAMRHERDDPIAAAMGRRKERRDE